MKIKKIILREIFTSRATPTLEIELISSEGISATAQIPEGKSKGYQEAVNFNFEKAKVSLEEYIKPLILGRDFDSIEKLDNFLIGLDGTKNKAKLGGNLTLGISISFAKLLAKKYNQPLFKIIKDEFFKGEEEKIKSPAIFANLINGGAHSENNLYFQEYLVIAFPKNSIKETILKIISFYNNLKEFIKKTYKKNLIPIGEEGGFSLNFENNAKPLFILNDLIKNQGLENEFYVGIDSAANHFFKEKFYIIDKKRYSTPELVDYYIELFKKIKNLISVEDPFAETDTEGFKILKKSLEKEKLLIGDDLTITSYEKINNAYHNNLINGVIIKPNQIGTLTESIIAIKISKHYNFKTIISHRSGETEDNFIIHLARASNAYGVKIGPPIRERILKYNELLRIYN